MAFKSFSREAFLLIIGAVISFVASIATTLITTHIDVEKELRTKKYTILEQLSKDIGQRLLYTEQYKVAFDSKNKVDIDSSAKKYRNSVKDWSAKDLMYVIQLKKFFDEDNYIKGIYNPMVNLGVFCEYHHAGLPYIIKNGGDVDTITNSNFPEKYEKLRAKSKDFIFKLYQSIK